MGIDLETLIGEGVVDTVLAIPPTKGGFAEPHPQGIGELVEAARGTEVKIVQSISTAIRHDAFDMASREMQVVQAANGYGAGAKGVFFHSYYPTGYPYADGDLANLRFMGHPELVEHKDKHYFVCQGPNGSDDTPGDYGLPHPLPAELVEGQSGPPQALYVSDDVAAWHAKGEVARCELRVRLVHLIDTDAFELWFNDELIPRESQEWLDWTYSVRPVPGNTRVLNCYWITVDLMRRGPLSRVGANQVRVDVKAHDPRVIYPVKRHDVELVVDYRDHRHAPRRDEWWRDPRGTE